MLRAANSLAFSSEDTWEPELHITCPALNATRFALVILACLSAASCSVSDGMTEIGSPFPYSYTIPTTHTSAESPATGQSVMPDGLDDPNKIAAAVEQKFQRAFHLFQKEYIAVGYSKYLLNVDLKNIVSEPEVERIGSLGNPCRGEQCSVPETSEGSVMGELLNSLLVAEPGTVLKSVLKVMHLVGIIFGLGAATVLDIVVIRFLVLRTITREHAVLVKCVSKVVTVGLVTLWISGVGYLCHYAAFDPERLGNQKVWAKIAIVGVLTINGHFIHHRVLPLVSAQIGRQLFHGLTRRECGQMLVFGTISATSWYVPLVLGAMPHFNFVVPAFEILAVYSVLLMVAIISTQGILNAVWKEEPPAATKARYEKLLQRAATVISSAPMPKPARMAFAA